MNRRGLATIRCVVRVVGVALIAATLVPAGYARFAGAPVGDGMRLPAGDTGTRYLAASGQKTSCTLRAEGQPPQSVDLPIVGARQLLDGVRITPPASGSNLSCTEGDVRVTSGTLLTLYPLAEYDYLLVILGALLVVLARFIRPRRPTH